ncbi:MAG: Tn3 family transposase [Thermoleophilaceae bacterium]
MHVLSYVDDEPYRREIKGMRNLQEGRHDLARTMFHGRKGELRHGYRDGMEDQLGALGLILNTITLWNTVYLDHAIEQLRADGYPVLRRRRRAAVAVHATAHQLPRPLLLRRHRTSAAPRRALRDPDAPDED